jgi:tight adherence protein B
VRYVPFVPRLEPLIAQAGLALSVGRVLLWMVGLALCATALLDLVTPAPRPIAVLAGIVFGIGAPIYYLTRRKRGRVQLFEEQLPGALDLLVRSLRIGHPLSGAIAVVAREMPDPIGSEFGIVLDEATYGLELPEAIENINDRIDLQDLRYLTVAINIQYASGGNLAEILSGLSQVIRARFHMFRKVKALTAEGRISAGFLSVFPIFMLFVMINLRWEAYAAAFQHPYFPVLAVATIAMLVINIIFMQSIVKLKI